MKKTILTLSVIATLLFSSCGSLEPKYTEEPFLKSYVFKNSIDYEWQKSLREEFIGEIYLGNIKIEGLDIVPSEEEQPRSLGEAVLIIFELEFGLYNIEETEKELKKQLTERFENILDNDVYFRWDPATYKNSEKLCEQSPKQALILFNRVVDRFLQYIEEVACEEVKTISWDYDLINDGDTYDGYEVIYEVGNGFYALVSLIEFEDGHYEAKILNKANALSEIQNYF